MAARDVNYFYYYLFVYGRAQRMSEILFYLDKIKFIDQVNVCTLNKREILQ